jgi:hypothetical protein
MYGRSFEKVVTDFVEVGDRSYKVCSNVTFVVELFQAAIDAYIFAFLR